MKARNLFLLFTFCFFINLSAQVNIKDSSIYTPLIGISYGFDFPAGDMANRFGNNSAVQMNVDFKTEKYWTFGVNGSYFFGKTLKENNIFNGLMTSDGNIIDQEGEFADVRVYERGFTVSATAGRMFAFRRPNPNSGVMFNVGLGFMQHKIRIETIGNNVPQLSTDYKKGYDRLTNGLLLSQDLGYLYLSNNRLLNFYFGFQCMEGFTQDRRSFDFALMQQDTKKRLDILYGAKVSWILPLYKKAPQEFYYY